MSIKKYKDLLEDIEKNIFDDDIKKAARELHCDNVTLLSLTVHNDHNIVDHEFSSDVSIGKFIQVAQGQVSENKFLIGIKNFDFHDTNMHKILEYILVRPQGVEICAGTEEDILDGKFHDINNVPDDENYNDGNEYEY